MNEGMGEKWEKVQAALPKGWNVRAVMLRRHSNGESAGLVWEARKKLGKEKYVDAHGYGVGHLLRVIEEKEKEL